MLRTHELRQRLRSPAHRTYTPTAYRKGFFMRPKSTLRPKHRRNVKSQFTSSQDPEACIEKGKQLLARHSFADAIHSFTEAIKSERLNLDALYSRGVCYMHLNEHKQALPDLLTVSKENPLFDKQLHVALAMCFVAVSDKVAALRHISKGLVKFPKFAEGYVIRGQLYNQMQRWEKAISDFRKAISINPKEGAAFMGLGESLIGLGDIQTALKVLTQASVSPETRQKALLRRAKLFFSEENLDEALEDVNSFLLHDSENPEVHYLKSLILIRKKLYTEAVLALEQVVKNDTNNLYLGDSIFHIGAIRIRERDFYGAIHTFKRVPTKLQVKDQPILTVYAEAVINLMKRKYKDGVKTFTKLIKKNYPIIQEYVGNCYAFRGYGFAALGKHDKALRDFKCAKSLNALDKASKFNQTLSRGLVCLSKHDKDSALRYFSKSLRQFPRNADPLLYHAGVLVSMAYLPDSPSRKLLEEAEELLSRAVDLRDSDFEFFFRSVVRYLLGKAREALEDARQAIDKAEDNMSEHYILRGLCQASLQDFQEALQDFSIAIQLDSSTQDGYLYRARCAYMLDDTNTAFGDYEKLIELNPGDHTYHLQTGNLLMMAGSYEEALKAYDSANSVKLTSEALALRAKAFVVLGQLEEGLSELMKAPDTLHADQDILRVVIRLTKEQNYSKVLNSLEKCTPAAIFEQKHLMWLRGVILVYMREYEEALEVFQKVLEIIHAHDPADLNSDDALTAEEENCEVLYNIAICHMAGNPKHSLMILHDLSEVLNTKHRGQVLFLSGVIEMSIGNKSQAENVFKEAARCDSESVSPYFDNKQTKILPLNTSNEFSSRFPLIQLPVVTEPTIMVRPAVCLPRVTPPGIELNIEHSARKYFTIDKIVPKPEAPWLNRVRGSIQFTDSIFDLESENSEETEVEEKSVKETESDNEQRRIKSATAIRRYSSRSLNESAEEDERVEPADIIDRIKAICQ